MPQPRNELVPEERADVLKSPPAGRFVQARLAVTMAAFHVLVQWYGLHPNVSDFVPLSVAEQQFPLLAMEPLPTVPLERSRDS